MSNDVLSSCQAIISFEKPPKQHANLFFLLDQMISNIKTNENNRFLKEFGARFKCNLCTEMTMER